jgi:hypothetical protein
MITLRNILAFLGLAATAVALLVLLPWLLYTNSANLHALQESPLIGSIPFIGTTLSYIYLIVCFSLLGAICYLAVQSSWPMIWVVALATLVSVAAHFFMGSFAIYTVPSAVIVGSILARWLRSIQKIKNASSPGR